MDYIKKHKKLTIAIGCLLVLLLIVFLLKVFIFPTVGKNAYGNRLEGMNEVRINQDSITKLKQELTDTGKVEKVSYDLRGRIINLNLDMKAGVDPKEAKDIAQSILKNFTDEQQKYYDIQVFLTQKGVEKTSYPYIGYKHKTSKSFVWTNN